MISILQTLFEWPNGIVVGNLIASAICVGVAAFHLDRLARKHHRIHMAHLKGISNLMPYEIQGPNADGTFDVINKDTKRIVEPGLDTKEDAERKVRVLHAVESNPEWEAKAEEK